MGCGVVAPSSDHLLTRKEPGIGKTAVLDAVHRSFVRHVGAPNLVSS